MKKEIIGYVNGVISAYENSMKRLTEQNVTISQGTKTLVNELNSLLDYVIDIPEGNTDVENDNARYVARITELENEVENLKEDVHISKFNEDLGQKRYEDLKAAKEPVSITLSLQTELQELKSQLAEAEETIENYADNESRLNKRVEVAENTKKGWEATAYNSINKADQLKAKNESLRANYKSLKKSIYEIIKENVELKATNDRFARKI